MMRKRMEIKVHEKGWTTGFDYVQNVGTKMWVVFDVSQLPYMRIGFSILDSRSFVSISSYKQPAMICATHPLHIVLGADSLLLVFCHLRN